MNQVSLEDRGKVIIELARNNHLAAQIAETSLQSIKTFLVAGQNFNQKPDRNDPMNLPPQISQTTQMTQPVMAPQQVQGAVYGQNLMPPMMGNQPYMATGGIPFLYHQQ